MSFNSVDYCLFYLIVFFVYYIIPQKIRYIWLVAASYYFYCCYNVRYAYIIVSVTMISYFAALIINKLKSSKETERNKRINKIVFVVAICMCFGFLLFYKYTNFLISNINFLLNIFNFGNKISVIDIVLPVGISFFTFQAVGYVVDVYRGVVTPENNLIRYALFLSFFPQLVAGPIERSFNLINQLREPQKMTNERLREGLFIILFGLWQKVLVADRVAGIVDKIFANFSEYTGIEMFIGVVLFGFQIYCDFSGYSNIAIGSAKLLGVDLMTNFRSPYLAKSVPEFWKRWHISLTSWFTDYLYIPLGGNKKGKVRQYINIIIVFLCSGLWHGAAWNYVFWGGLNGALNVISRVNKNRVESQYNPNNITDRIIRIIGTFLLIDFTWLFFRAPSLGSALSMIKKGIGYIGMGPFLRGDSFDKVFGNSLNLIIVLLSIIMLFILDLIQDKKGSILCYISNQHILIRWGTYLTLIMMIVLFGAYGEGYEQINFIYFQF